MPKLPSYDRVPAGGRLAGVRATQEADAARAEAARLRGLGEGLRAEGTRRFGEIRSDAEATIKTEVDAIKAEALGAISSASQFVLAEAAALVGSGVAAVIGTSVSITIGGIAVSVLLKGIGAVVGAVLLTREFLPVAISSYHGEIGVTDQVGRHWDEQLSAWRRLYAAAKNGRRLRMYDRVFHFRGVEGIGFDMTRIGEVYLLPDTVKIVQGVAKRLGFEWEYLGPKFDARKKFDTDWLSAVDPFDDNLVETGGSFLRAPETGVIATDGRGWPVSKDVSPDLPWLRDFRLPDGRVAFPEIPAEWAHMIPTVQIVFWVAPPSISGEALLEAYEVELGRRVPLSTVRTTVIAGAEFTTSSSGLLHRGPGDASPDGSGIVAQSDWKYEGVGRGYLQSWPDVLKPLDEVDVVTNTTYVKGEYFGIDLPQAWHNLWMTTRFPDQLDPEHYLRMLVELNQYRGAEWLAIQEGIEIQSDPKLLDAIDLARGVLDGDPGSIAYAREVIDRARRGEASYVADLIRLRIALAGGSDEATEGV